jgi:hypothetical protein
VRNQRLVIILQLPFSGWHSGLLDAVSLEPAARTESPS